MPLRSLTTLSNSRTRSLNAAFSALTASSSARSRAASATRILVRLGLGRAEDRDADADEEAVLVCRCSSAAVPAAPAGVDDDIDVDGAREVAVAGGGSRCEPAMEGPMLAWSREVRAAVAEVRESEEEDRCRLDGVGCVGPVRRKECGSEVVVLVLGRLVLAVLVEDADALEAALAVWARSRESSRVRRFTCWMGPDVSACTSVGLGDGRSGRGRRQGERTLVQKEHTYDSFLLLLHLSI